MGEQKNTYKYQKLRGLVRKLHLIDLRGGGCEKCGYKENLGALDFHHKDPKEKETQLDIRILSNGSMKWIMEEFDKCLVLCSNCHRCEHHPELKIDDIRVIANTNGHVLNVRSINKPKCLDCDKEINYGNKRCKECSLKELRLVERPSKEILLAEIKLIGYSATGRKYGVSDNAIRKWVK
jgi:CO dehydrogenase/acetyl-CoA synthase alpha subunit